MQKIRAAVIGCGVIGPTHIESLQQQPEVTVDAVCDLVPEKAKALAEKYKIPTIAQTAAQIFADPELDLVCVCTDHASHLQLCLDALKAGKHVVCEKALATSFDGIEAFKKAQRDYPKQVFSGIFQHRFDPPMQMLKRLVEENEMGQILTASIQTHCVRSKEYYQSGDWRGTWAQEGGSVMINQAIHYLDLLAWITGGVSSLCGHYSNLTHQGVIETEDTAVAALRLKNGALGTLEATCSSHINWENTLYVHGTDGSVELREGKPLKVVFRDNEKTEKYSEAFANCRDQRRISAGANHYGFGHAAQFVDVIAAIREKRPPFVTAASACHANEMVLALYQSCKTGAWVDIKSPL